MKHSVLTVQATVKLHRFLPLASIHSTLARGFQGCLAGGSAA